MFEVGEKGRLDEPASGLAVATALASSHRNRPLVKDVLSKYPNTRQSPLDWGLLNLSISKNHVIHLIFGRDAQASAREPTSPKRPKHANPGQRSSA